MFVPFPYCFAVPRSSMRCAHSKSEDQLPSESDDQQTFLWVELNRYQDADVIKTGRYFRYY